MPLLLCLVLVKLKGFLIQHMLDHICANLIVGIESIQMSQSLFEARKVIVDLKLTPSLWELLKLTKEW